jgi:hypothetical protein
MGNTSYAVQKRYREKTLRKVSIDLKIELADKWEEKLTEDGITKAEFLRNAINNYIEDKGTD